MDPNKLIKYISIGILSATIGYLGSQYVHTPQRAWNADVNNDGIEDIVVESRDKKRVMLYGISNSEKRNNDFVSGEEANKLFNAVWREEYEKHFGEKPDYNRFNLETTWEHWR